MGKRLEDINKNLDRKKVYKLDEAIAIIKDNVKAKFDESIDISMNLNIDTSKTDQNLRGSVALPNGTGRKCTIAVFARDAKAEEAKAAGAEFVGAEDLVEQIKAGTINFDTCIATPDMMALVGQVARVLGPRGLMPNPKLGTVTVDVKGIIESLKAGRVNYKNDKAGVIHALVGKSSFTKDALLENAKTFVKAIEAAKPGAAKGTFVKSMYISSTQGTSLMFEMN